MRLLARLVDSRTEATEYHKPLDPYAPTALLVRIDMDLIARAPQHHDEDTVVTHLLGCGFKHLLNYGKLDRPQAEALTRVAEELRAFTTYGHFLSAPPGSLTATVVPPGTQVAGEPREATIDLEHRRFRFGSIDLPLDTWTYGRADLRSIGEMRSTVDLRDNSARSTANVGNGLIFRIFKGVAAHLLRTHGRVERARMERLALPVIAAIGKEGEHRFADVFQRFAGDSAECLVYYGMAAPDSWEGTGENWTVFHPAARLGAQPPLAPEHLAALTAIDRFSDDALDAAVPFLVERYLEDESYDTLEKMAQQRADASAHARAQAHTVLAEVERLRAAVA